MHDVKGTMEVTSCLVYTLYYKCHCLLGRANISVIVDDNLGLGAQKQNRTIATKIVKYCVSVEEIKDRTYFQLKPFRQFIQSENTMGKYEHILSH